ARHESQRRRDQGKGTGQVDVGPHTGFEVRGSEFGVHVLRFLGSRFFAALAFYAFYTIATAIVAATAVLMKFSMSLFRIPRPSSVAARALSTRAPAVAATTTARIADAGIRPVAAPIAASAKAAVRPAAVPSSDIAPGVPGLTRPNDVTRNVDRPHALPISLATVSLPPATSDATSATSAALACGVVIAANAAALATPQLAIALPAPRRPPRSSAIPRTILRLSPSLEVTAAARNVANSSSHAPAPPPR